MVPGHVIDPLIVSWIVASIMLLLVFVRYTRRCYREDGWSGVYRQMKYFVGLVAHHIGNLTLLGWFWWEVHSGAISLRMSETDTVIVVAGCSFAVGGVLYKVRIFTDSAAEVAFTTIVTLVLSALSIFALYMN